MFDKDRFIQRCIEAAGEDPSAIREIVEEAVSDPAGIVAALGEPGRAGITPLYIAPDLTVIHFVWAPCMSLMPHNHQMFSVVGVYSGREDNVLWRRTPTSIRAAGATSLGSGDVTVLGKDVIHSVLNPIEKKTCALHVYGGDFFHPAQPRSEWDHETLTERPWNVDRVKGLFRVAEERYAGSREGWRQP
jgi:predicted metal-dependent enzyme (double-stranded beta helix superfamily)